MKKLLAIILAVAMVMSMAVAVSADAPEGEANLINYDFENGDISAWAHHWGDWALSVTDDGMLHTEKGDMNIMFTTYTNLPVLTAGTEYKVTADVYLCDNEYLVSKETGETAPFESATFMVSIKTGGIDGTALASKKQTIVCGDTETFTFTYTPNADVTDAALCFNMDGSDWSLDGVSYCLDNVKITYALPEEEAPAGDVVIGGKGYDEEVLYTSTSIVDASIEGWGWYNAFEQGTFGSYDAALAALNGTYIKVTHVGSINAPFWQTTDSLNNKTTVFGTTAGVTYFNTSVLYDDMVALGDKGWGNVVIAGNGDEAETVSKVEIVTLVEVPAVEEEVIRGSGYFMTGEETHAMIIGKAIITTPHEFNENGDCKYCRYHTEVVVEDIIVEQPTESTEEESEDITVEEPKEDTNPGTGLTLAVIPAIVALAAVVISKR